MRPRLDAKIIARIETLHKQGLDYPTIAQRMGIARSTAQRYVYLMRQREAKAKQPTA